MLLVIACSSAPKKIPLAETRLLAANSQTLGVIEQQIATKKTEQDILEQRLYETKEKSAQSPKDETLKSQVLRMEKENALSQAELAVLIARHQLEAARLLKRPDLAEYEKALAKQEEEANERRKELAGGR